jgi:hypothetical protein
MLLTLWSVYFGRKGIIWCLNKVSLRRRYPYFDIVAGLAWSEDPESYAGGRIATGRGSYVAQVKVMTQTKRDSLVLQVRGWAWG